MKPSPVRRAWGSSGKGIIFRGTLIGEAEVRQIRKLIAQYRDRTQFEIARRVCRHFKWYRPNGDLAEQAFVGVLRRLGSLGLLRLPAPRSGARGEASWISASLSELRWPDVEPFSALVESAWSVMKIFQAGWPNVVAIGGAGIIPEQRSLLQSESAIVLFLDGDHTGRRASNRLRDLPLHPRMKVMLCPLGKDPADLSERELWLRLSPHG